MGAGRREAENIPPLSGRKHRQAKGGASPKAAASGSPAAADRPHTAVVEYVLQQAPPKAGGTPVARTLSGRLHYAAQGSPAAQPNSATRTPSGRLRQAAQASPAGTPSSAAKTPSGRLSSEAQASPAAGPSSAAGDGSGKPQQAERSTPAAGTLAQDELPAKQQAAEGTSSAAVLMEEQGPEGELPAQQVAAAGGGSPALLSEEWSFPSMSPWSVGSLASASPLSTGIPSWRYTPPGCRLPSVSPEMLPPSG